MIRNLFAWGALGITAVLGMWYAYSLPGAIAMFGAIGMAFVLWNKLGSKGSWIALIIIGGGMGGVLGWQAVTGSRCPAPGTKVFLKEDRPPIDCNDVRASAAVMASFFALIMGIGIGAPLYARSARREEDALLDGASS